MVIENSEKKRIGKIISLLEKKYGDPTPPLNHSTAFEFLVAVILSAQCTDERVNMVTPGLFKKFKTPSQFAKADINDIREAIKSISFPNNKAKHIKRAAEKILQDFDGKVPDSLEEIITLPGVGRKTGNVIIGDHYKKPEGFVVDTHVGRLSVRLGLTKETDSKKAITIERDLMHIIPQEKWPHMSLHLVFHGRDTCGARKALCDSCVLNKVCPSARKIPAYSK